MKRNIIIFNKQSNGSLKPFSISDYPNKLSPSNNFQNGPKLIKNIFKNHELQKTLTLNINYTESNLHPINLRISKNLQNCLDCGKNSFLTAIPMITPRERNMNQNHSSKTESFHSLITNNSRCKSFIMKRKIDKKISEFKYFSDEKFFSSEKHKKKFLFPRRRIHIKKYRVNHDTNSYNFQHMITDYTKNYERNSYKIKKVVQKDLFINKIKKDLLKLKFNNKIKAYNDL